jgi:hypothetical protein
VRESAKSSSRLTRGLQGNSDFTAACNCHELADLHPEARITVLDLFERFGKEVIHLRDQTCRKGEQPSNGAGIMGKPGAANPLSWGYNLSPR